MSLCLCLCMCRRVCVCIRVSVCMVICICVCMCMRMFLCMCKCVQCVCTCTVAMHYGVLYYFALLLYVGRVSGIGTSQNCIAYCFDLTCSVGPGNCIRSRSPPTRLSTTFLASLGMVLYLREAFVLLPAPCVINANNQQVSPVWLLVDRGASTNTIWNEIYIVLHRITLISTSRNIGLRLFRTNMHHQLRCSPMASCARPHYVVEGLLPGAPILLQSKLGSPTHRPMQGCNLMFLVVCSCVGQS